MATKEEKIDHNDDSQEEYPKADLPAPERRGSVAMNIVENPLKRKPQAEVFEDARIFAESNGMSEHAELFGQAALVARDPTLIHSIQELTPDQRNALDYEKANKWNGPKMMWFTVVLCAIGAATQDAFGFWIIGLVNSIIFLTAGLIGAWIVDPLNHYFGRRGEIFITAACLTATPIGSAFAHNWQELFAARFVRVVIGIFLGFCANVIVKDTGAISWRLQLGSAFIPSFILMCGIWFCPESPRWLMKKGRHAEAFKSMSKIRSHPIIAARDFYYSYILYSEELKLSRGSTYFSRLADCFTVPRIRRANYGASTVMLAQQMCGINIISFYSSTIFKNVGYTDVEALYASLGYGAVQVVSTIPTLFMIDKFGRRRLCLITFPLMCVFLLAAGLSLLNPTTERAPKLAPIVLFVYLFTICYGLGEGPVAFRQYSQGVMAVSRSSHHNRKAQKRLTANAEYSAEVFPTIQREQGMAWAVFINNFFAGVLSLTFPRMQAPDVMTPTGAFGFYAGLNLLAWLMIFCFVRETKQLTLEELDQVFSVPTSEFLKYEATVRVPWWMKRYLLFRKGLVEPPVNIAKDDEFDKPIRLEK